MQEGAFRIDGCARTIRVVDLDIEGLDNVGREGATNAQLLFDGQILWKPTEQVGQSMQVELSGKARIRRLGLNAGGFVGREIE